jgi:radical SAM superfamily enzyme YgiQ (UPF0313 family)
MANVVFVSYAGYPYTPSSLCPDNGLGLLAAVLRDAGHHVRILDFGTVDVMRRLYPEELSRRVGPLMKELAGGGPPPPALLQELAAADAALTQHQAAEVQAIGAEVAEEVASIEPAMVGFKLWNGDGFSGPVAIAEAVRRRYPRAKIFAGGPHATWCGRVIYEATDVFDGVVLGEAEDRIIDLVARAADGKSPADLPGIVFSAESDAKPPCSVDLNEIPLACYDEAVYPAMAGDQKLKLFVLDDSRGCPYCCAFCTHPVESGRRLRTRSAGRIVDDMQALLDRHGARAFRFAGSSTPGSLMADVAREILRRGLQVRYTSFAHFASSLPEHYEVMRRSGLYSMFFGLETGSEDLLRKATGKPLRLDDVREAVLAAKAAGIAVVTSMIVPLPFETEATLAESVGLLLELKPDSVPVQFPGLLPGTPWYDEPEKYAFEVDREQFLRDNLDYKIKLLFPPMFWKPLPYKVNGMAFSEFVKITEGFVRTLEQNGVLTGVPDDNMLMAALVGMSPREFRDTARWLCATGDAEGMQRLVTGFNRAATAPPAT